MPPQDTWSIQNRSHHCALTKEPFKDGDIFFTALFINPTNGQYERKDFSTSAWEQTTEKPFSFWKNTYVKQEKPKPLELQPKESTETLLLRLQNEDKPETENVRYLLALMLERKNILRQTDSQKTDLNTLRVYQQKYSDQVYVIKDPNLSLDKIEEVQKEVIDLLATQL